MPVVHGNTTDGGHWILQRGVKLSQVAREKNTPTGGQDTMVYHAMLQPIEHFINSTVPFRSEDFETVKGLIEDASSDLNRAILTGAVNGLDVPSIERQMILLRITARNRRDDKIVRPRILGQSSPPTVKRTAKILPFRIGAAALKRQLLPAS